MRHDIRTGFASLLSIAALLAACSRGGEESRPTPTSGPATTLSAAGPVSDGDRSCVPERRVSSRGDFDGLNGEFVVHLFTVDVRTRSLTFDVVQLLVGEDAVREHRRTNPTDPYGPPNDYVLVNSYVHTDSAVVSATAAVWTLTEQLEYRMSSLERLQADSRPTRRPALGLYGLTFHGGTVTRLCQVYTP